MPNWATVIVVLAVVVAALTIRRYRRWAIAELRHSIGLLLQRNDAEASRQAWAEEAMRLQMLLDQARDLVEVAYEEDFGKILPPSLRTRYRLFRTLGIPVEQARQEQAERYGWTDGLPEPVYTEESGRDQEQ